MQTHISAKLQLTVGHPVQKNTTSPEPAAPECFAIHASYRVLDFPERFPACAQFTCTGHFGRLRNWRAQYEFIQCILVHGNHDKNAGEPPADLNTQTVDEPYLMGDLALQHIPALTLRTM